MAEPALRKPRCAAGTQAAGKRLWSSVVDEFDLEEHELALLREAVRTVDQLDTLAGLIERDGEMVEGRFGPKLHPAIAEARQLRIALARTLAALRLPAGDEDARPQRRVGVRGIYGAGSNVRPLPRRSAS